MDAVSLNETLQFILKKIALKGTSLYNQNIPTQLPFVKYGFTQIADYKPLKNHKFDVLINIYAEDLSSSRKLSLDLKKVFYACMGSKFWSVAVVSHYDSFVEEIPRTTLKLQIITQGEINA